MELFVAFALVALLLYALHRNAHKNNYLPPHLAGSANFTNIDDRDAARIRCELDIAGRRDER